MKNIVEQLIDLVKENYDLVVIRDGRTMEIDQFFAQGDIRFFEGWITTYERSGCVFIKKGEDPKKAYDTLIEQRREKSARQEVDLFLNKGCGYLFQSLQCDKDLIIRLLGEETWTNILKTNKEYELESAEKLEAAAAEIRGK